LQRFNLLIPSLLIFLTLGIFLDITAVGFMIMGADKSILSVHGLLGYSAMITMILDTFFIWRFYLKSGYDVEIPKNLITYTKYAYSWWVIAYLTGSILVIWK